MRACTLLEIDTVCTSVQGAISHFEVEILPELRRQRGDGGTIVLVTPDGKGLLLSLWASEAAAAPDTGHGFYAEQLARFGALLRSPPEVERYELAFVDVPGAQGS